MAATRQPTVSVHPRNRLNDLPNGEWLRRTKSFWLSRSAEPAGDGASEVLAAFTQWLRTEVGDDEATRLMGQIPDSFLYSVTPPRDALKSRHPATFSESDIERLITLFSKEGETVLDPFAGVGSSLIAAMRGHRRAIGIELSAEWAGLARQRVAAEALALDYPSALPDIVVGDSSERIDELPSESVDFVVTSPPYWSILSKTPGLKTHAERLSKGLATDYGLEAQDLARVADYREFLDRLAAIFGKCLRVCRSGGYMAVIVSDFRHGARFYLYHADLASVVEEQGWVLSGVTVLAQDNKTLYPYGIPYAFVSNVHHQYILVFRKPSATRLSRVAGSAADRTSSVAGRPSGSPSRSGREVSRARSAPADAEFAAES